MEDKARTKIFWNHIIYNLVHHYWFINKALTVQFNPVDHPQQLISITIVICTFWTIYSRLQDTVGIRFSKQEQNHWLVEPWIP